MCGRKDNEQEYDEKEINTPDSSDYSEGTYESYEPTTDELDDNNPPSEDSD